MGFARSKEGLEYALVCDATNKTAAEVHRMSPSDRRLTARLRARYYKWYFDAWSGDGRQ